MFAVRHGIPPRLGARPAKARCARRRGVQTGSARFTILNFSAGQLNHALQVLNPDKALVNGAQCRGRTGGCCRPGAEPSRIVAMESERLLGTDRAAERRAASCNQGGSGNSDRPRDPRSVLRTNFCWDSEENYEDFGWLGCSYIQNSLGFHAQGHAARKLDDGRKI